MSRFYGKKPEPVTLPATAEPVVVVTLPYVEEDFDITVDPHLLDTPVDDGDDNDVLVDDGEEAENDS